MKEYKTKEYAHGFSNVVRLGLERISKLLELLGDPQDRLKFIHVAGTNGKGSVSAFMEAGLIADNRKVGKFTSPNLVRINERICINGEEISDKDLENVLTKVNSAAEKVKNESGEEPTQFEIWTAAAMCHFEDKNCDIVILEVGLGGEFDATNIINSCEVAVICHIDFDHTAYLGNTLSEIAKAKCGIIKPNITSKTVVSAEQYDEAMSVIEQTAEKFGHKLTVAVAPASVARTDIYETMMLDNRSSTILSLGGKYQLANAALAVKALEALGMPQNFIVKGLETARHRARFERLDEKTIFDGGHNPDGVRALDASLKRYFPNKKIRIIYACMADKDIESTLNILKSNDREFVFTAVSANPRAMASENLQKFAKEKCKIHGTCAPSLKLALEAPTDADLTVICGSLYLYSDLPKKYL